MPGLVKNRLPQYLSSENVYSQPAGPSGEQTRLSLLEKLPLGACSGILAHIEEKCALSELHVNFARREKKPKPDVLFAGNGVREILKGKIITRRTWFSRLLHRLLTRASVVKGVVSWLE